MKRRLWLLAWLVLTFVVADILTACGPIENRNTSFDVIPVTGNSGSGAEAPVPELPAVPTVEQNAAPTASPPPTSTAPLPPPVVPGPSWQPDHSAPTIQNDPPEKRILVDLSEQHVYAFENGAVVMDFPVSTGRNDNTAVGTFKILDKKPYPYSEPWGFWMPHWMGIYWVAGMENGFHALPVLEGGETLWGDQIGTPASFGCVVLLPDDMERLFEWSEVGTPVEIVE